MAKNSKPETSTPDEPKPQDKALALIESFEQGELVNPEMEIIEGVEQLTTPVIKFEKDGQTLIGLFTGSKECPSTMPGPTDYFYFHTVVTVNNMEVGFCGSKAIDEALSKLQPFRHIVFIKFISEKKVKQGNFKQFQIMAIDMENKNNPLYRCGHAFVRVYENLTKENNQPQGAEQERGDNVKY